MSNHLIHRYLLDSNPVQSQHDNNYKMTFNYDDLSGDRMPVINGGEIYFNLSNEFPKLHVNEPFEGDIFDNLCYKYKVDILSHLLYVRRDNVIGTIPNDILDLKDSFRRSLSDLRLEVWYYNQLETESEPVEMIIDEGGIDEGGA